MGHKMGRACLFCGYPLKIGANEESIRCPACERENREELFPVIVRWEEEGLPFDRIYLQTNFPFGSSLLVGKGQKAVLKGAGEETALSEGRHDLSYAPEIRRFYTWTKGSTGSMRDLCFFLRERSHPCSGFGLSSCMKPGKRALC